MSCKQTFVWKKWFVKKGHEKIWFKLWIYDHYTVKELCHLSGYSDFKIKGIKRFWLQRTPEFSQNFQDIQYVIYDGTYFHKTGCLINLMNALDQTILDPLYAPKEGGNTILPWLEAFKAQGLKPLYMTMDGEQSTLKTIRRLWPGIKIQRCLYHIQHEGMRWLRTYPKTQAGKELRKLLLSLCPTKSVKERDNFIDTYKRWLKKYKDFVFSLPMSIKANFDLKRTISLIDHALPDMFHYLMDPNIPSTTNAIEGFHSRLKPAYHQHRGLSQANKIRFLKWYCYFENQQKINN